MPFRALFPALFATLASPALAQDDATGTLSLELNSVAAQEGDCRMSFVVLNGQAVDLTSVVLEAVLFDADGAVDRLTLFDFGALPTGRTRVRQFVVPDLACERLGKVLINGAQTCDAADGTAGLCMDGLTLSTRIGVEVIG
ncbi:hypothetical protein [Tropicibacter sp. S64]|uniref:hypothetical protein n=1 Tax=Tropicibacter sp. S64 TaxID=3415122 RepID=UPI003C79E6E2